MLVLEIIVCFFRFAVCWCSAWYFVRVKGFIFLEKTVGFIGVMVNFFSVVEWVGGGRRERINRLEGCRCYLCSLLFSFVGGGLVLFVVTVVFRIFVAGYIVSVIFSLIREELLSGFSVREFLESWKTDFITFRFLGVWLGLRSGLGDVWNKNWLVRVFNFFLKKNNFFMYFSLGLIVGYLNLSILVLWRIC